MHLYLVRYPNPDSTPGDLIINREVFCHTLEDIVRSGVKIPGESAIPAGSYRIGLDFSNRFKKILPHLFEVPGFDGIRMHGGNTTANTEGCILCGMAIRGLHEIANCAPAIDGIIRFLQRDPINYIHIYPS